MRVGIGLPTMIPGAPAALVAPWARAAEAAGFASLGVHDRLAYDCLDPMLSLASAAAVTERIELATLVLIAPLRSAALLARQAESLERLSSDRFTLGVGVGPREDDYRLAGQSWARRGATLDSHLDTLQQRWRADRVVVGGAGDVAYLRMARWTAGYVHGGGSPRQFRSAVDRVLAAWSDLGRAGRPRIWGTGYFALGPNARRHGMGDLVRYYGFLGSSAEAVAGAQLVASEDEIAVYADGYRENGCDDLVLFPTIADRDQLDRLAEVVTRRCLVSGRGVAHESRVNE
jgi:alkanesulfonate monooxygenase SsuD/methylene tetrahydromethanopterin reductase-like flavin-dependent oxidoreductase (luciferase family)